jgi:dipeptidyl aminopeptidase/acylaminoacyl peptidase
MTLMAMLTSPDTFAAGAALRPVTDWAHYGPWAFGSGSWGWPKAKALKPKA